MTLLHAVKCLVESFAIFRSEFPILDFPFLGFCLVFLGFLGFLGFLDFLGFLGFSLFFGCGLLVEYWADNYRVVSLKEILSINATLAITSEISEWQQQLWMVHANG